METASVREASARVIAALAAAGRSRTAIKRHEAELNAFARFLQARGQDLPAEADCLDFVAERSGCRLAGLREPASSRQAQFARRPLVLLMECLDGGMPRVGQATAPLADRCPARFRPARDEYLTACRRRNAEASVVTKQRKTAFPLARDLSFSINAFAAVSPRNCRYSLLKGLSAAF